MSSSYLSILSTFIPSTFYRVLIGIILGPVTYLLGSAIYNIHFHPLSSYHGPKYATATRLWWLAALFRGNLTAKIQRLHEEYGDVVRIAPNELSYTVPIAWKHIYGHRPGASENPKDPAENFDMDHDHPSIVHADREKHSQLRRILSNSFSLKSIRNHEPVIQRYVDLLIAKLGENCNEGKTPLDIQDWFSYTTSDVIGQLTFNESFGCLERGGHHPWWVTISATIIIGTYIRGLKRLPGVLRLWTYFLKHMPKSVQETREAQSRLIREMVLRRKSRTTEHVDFMTHLIQAENKGDLDLEDVCVNAESLIFGGSETTASLLAGATYYLTRNPAILKKLVDEIQLACPKEEDLCFENINRLPYLTAVINESLRIYPPVPSSHNRRTPAGGAEINGRFVPEHVSVGIDHWSMNHSARNFLRPDEFIPERWLDSPLFKDDKKDAMQVFSFGPRNCIGQHLVQIEPRLILAKLLWTFDLELAEESFGWDRQKIYTVWRKPPLMVKLNPVVRTQL